MSVLRELVAVELERAIAMLRAVSPAQGRRADVAALPVRRLVMPCNSDGARIDRFVVGLFLYRPESR